MLILLLMLVLGIYIPVAKKETVENVSEWLKKKVRECQPFWREVKPRLLKFSDSARLYVKKVFQKLLTLIRDFSEKLDSNANLIKMSEGIKSILERLGVTIHRIRPANVFFVISLMLVILLSTVNRGMDSVESDSYDRSTFSASKEADEYDYCRMCKRKCKKSELLVRETSTNSFNSVCQDCSEKLWWRKEIKKARNRWVDENPHEARRRGIHKIY